MESKTNVVLVHGAWASEFAWMARPRMAAR